LGGVENPAQIWFRRRTTHWHDWPREQLMRWKDSRGARISVVIPARDEEATVGDVVEAIAAASMTGKPLVDELVVMDSDSRDRTAEVAARRARS
jgi:glucosyl-3-phosphoglycerate synthase